MEIKSEGSINKLRHRLYEESESFPPNATYSRKTIALMKELPANRRLKIVNKSIYGTTLLSVATVRRQTHMIRYLVEFCKADVNRPFQFHEDLKLYKTKTLLYVAARLGRCSVVKTLVECGAEVNKTSLNNATPLYEACVLHTFSMVELLLSLGADPNIPTESGDTCLMVAVNNHNAHLCRLLVDNGADREALRYGNPPIFYAIINDLPDCVNALMAGIDPDSDCLFSTAPGACVSEAYEILMYLLKKKCLAPWIIANGLELVGSYYILKNENFEKALHCWERALSVRQEFGCPKPQMPPKEVCSNVSEFQTFEEFSAISMNSHMTILQSIVITQRILGPYDKSWLRGRVEYLTRLGHIQRSIDIQKYIWKGYNAISRLNSDTYEATKHLVVLLMSLYQRYVRSGGNGDTSKAFLDVVDVFRVLATDITGTRRKTALDRGWRYMNYFDSILTWLCNLMYLMVMYAKTEDERDTVRRLVRRLVSTNVVTFFQNNTLLHLCLCSTHTHNQFYMSLDPILPSYAVASLLLECGALVNKTNGDKHSPLRIVTLPFYFNHELQQLLLEYGAHIDQTDILGNTPASVLAVRNPSVDVFGRLTLQCLASRVIARTQTLRDVYHDILPRHVANFVDLHKYSKAT